jgi:CDP-diacylglycerol--serine O-phosphatidyltransferase
VTTEPSAKKLRKGIYVLPNLFTTASLLCGFSSILITIKGNYFIAAALLLVAAILDGLDGRIARYTNTTTKFGAEYDSLSDLIAFGAAPAVLVYTWGLVPYGKWGWMASSLFIVCGALRLARFNIQIGIVESKVFNGLPIPAAASVVATGVLLHDYLGGKGPFNSIFVLVGVFCVALLMISNIKYYSFKKVNFFSKKPFMSFFCIVCLMIVTAVEPQIVIFSFAVGYTMSGPLWLLFKLGQKVYLSSNKKDK